MSACVSFWNTLCEYNGLEPSKEKKEGDADLTVNGVSFQQYADAWKRCEANMQSHDGNEYYFDAVALRLLFFSESEQSVAAWIYSQ